MPADNYYPDVETEASPTDTGKAPERPPTPEEKDGADTTLVSLSVFGESEPEPGQKCTFEVVRLYDDQAELKYLGNEEEEPSEPTEEAAGGEMQGAMDKLGAMAEA